MAEPIIHTSESVSEGHPDKLADQISDAILDEALRQDKGARVAIETLVTHGMCVVAGELTMNGYVDIKQVVRDTICSVGYTSSDLGFDGKNCGVALAVQEQSPDIAVGVDKEGAGDQGIMFGLAARETPELMPLPIVMAHALTRQAAQAQRERDELGPDSKGQVSVVYENGKPAAISAVVMSAQHAEHVADHQGLINEAVVEPVLAKFDLPRTDDFALHINPTGRFVLGGPAADTGLTGRKIIVDTYGGLCPHGGGAFSGKDPTKVDRSAAYMARHVAKCVVAAGLADRCQIGLAYSIGVAQPVAVNVECFGTHTIEVAEIERRIRDRFDLSPRGIIEHLDLRKPQYLPTAKNGHFGNPAFPWEGTAPVDDLKA